MQWWDKDLEDVTVFPGGGVSARLQDVLSIHNVGFLKLVNKNK